MRTSKAMVVSCAFVLLALLAGCGKVFFFSFRNEQALFNDEVAWDISGQGSYEFLPSGISLDDKALLCPYAFKGDVTIRIRLGLGFTGDEVGQLFLLVSNEPIWSPSAFHMLTFAVADPSVQGVSLIEKGDDYTLHKIITGLVPGIIKEGENSLEMVKKGDHYKFTLNGTLLGEYDAQQYLAAWFFVQIKGQLGLATDAASMVIEEFRAVSSGEMQEL